MRCAFSPAVRGRYRQPDTRAVDGVSRNWCVDVPCEPLKPVRLVTDLQLLELLCRRHRSLRPCRRSRVSDRRSRCMSSGLRPRVGVLRSSRHRREWIVLSGDNVRGRKAGEIRSPQGRGVRVVVLARVADVLVPEPLRRFTSEEKTFAVRLPRWRLEVVVTCGIDEKLVRKGGDALIAGLECDDCGEVPAGRVAAHGDPIGIDSSSVLCSNTTARRRRHRPLPPETATMRPTGSSARGRPGRSCRGHPSPNHRLYTR